MLPVLPSIGVFASVFGAAAAEKGLSLAETIGMSAFVYAGAAQMVSLQLWQSVWTPSTLLAVAVVTATINARMILMGAAMQHWLSAAPRGFNILNLFFFTDANWLIGTRYHAKGGRDLGVLFGAGVALWLLWVTMTLPGYIAGSLISEPRRWGIDLVLPIFFAISLAPLWRGPRAALPWLVAAVTALMIEQLIGGYVHIVLGALAGAAVGAFMPAEPDTKAHHE
jgi:predicted branched-subunit amino acid permease